MARLNKTGGKSEWQENQTFEADEMSSDSTGNRDIVFGAESKISKTNDGESKKSGNENLQPNLLSCPSSDPKPMRWIVGPDSPELPRNNHFIRRVSFSTIAEEKSGDVNSLVPNINLSTPCNGNTLAPPCPSTTNLFPPCLTISMAPTCPNITISPCPSTNASPYMRKKNSPPMNKRQLFNPKNNKLMDKAVQKHLANKTGEKTDQKNEPTSEQKLEVPLNNGGMRRNSTFNLDPMAMMKRIHMSSVTLDMEGDIRKVAQAFFSKKIDRTPRNLFVEMDELKNGVWQQQARWIRYEEDFLEGAGRWGKPHVSTLTFSSLVSLHLVLEESVLMLDVATKSFHSLMFDVAEEFGVKNGISDEVKMEVLRTLLMPHKFVDRQYQIMNQENEQDMTPEEIDFHRRSNKENIINRLKKGSEGVSTLVGTLDSLEEPLVAFIRLCPPIVMPNIIEAQIPVRFIFILFTPNPSPYMNSHEIGKSFSTLMSNKKVQKVINHIEERQELFDLINHFMDETVVVPVDDLDKDHLFNLEKIYDIKNKNKKQKRLSLGNVEKLWHEKSNQGKKLFDFQRRESVATLKDFESLGSEKTLCSNYNPLERTNVPFGGVIHEMKTRYPQYISDITDAFSPMCVASVFFIFFASLAGAIAFGGLLGDKTGGLIGIPETLITTSVSGIIFSLFCGQPLVIVGVTGPIMVYDESLFKFSKTADVEFLTWRVWISFWTFLIAMVVAGFQGSFVVKFFTKFTKEIFESFIATVFIVEALIKTANFFKFHPPTDLEDYCSKPDVSTFLHNISLTLDEENLRNETGFMDSNIGAFNDTATNFTNVFYHGNETSVANFTSIPHPVVPFKVEPNTAFLSFILQFATFGLAYTLRQFINGRALGRRLRHVLSDFAIPIAIVVMVCIGMGFPHVYTQKLNVPSGLDVTSPDKRSWFVSPMGEAQSVPIWIPFISVLPAILLYLVLFMETSICELILMDKAKKGCGLHLDIVLLTMINVGCALFGGPWICAATVRAVTHLNSLIVMSKTHAPGETPSILEVKDQRVTSFFVALLVGLSVLLSPLLKLVPNAVIFGVFLYMGTSSIININFFKRFCLIWTPIKHHPSVSYVTMVPTMKMHLFTFFQCLGLGTLWLVKSTPAGLVFPFFIIAMIPFRLLLKYFFTPEELDHLDGPNAGKTTSSEH